MERVINKTTACIGGQWYQSRTEEGRLLLDRYHDEGLPHSQEIEQAVNDKLITAYPGGLRALARDAG